MYVCASRCTDKAGTTTARGIVFQFPTQPNLRYCAPEVTRPGAADTDVGSAADMFALGCVMLEVRHGWGCAHEHAP